MQPSYQYSLPQNARQVVETDLNCSELTPGRPAPVPRDVRLWHKTDLPGCLLCGRYRGVKQTTFARSEYFRF